MLSFQVLRDPSLRKTLLLHILVRGTTAAAFILALTGAGNAAIIVRRPGPQPPVLLPVPGVVVRQTVWITPPAPRVIVAPAPRLGWVWSPGYWNWNGDAYVWVGGTWLAERPGFRFVPAGWERFPGGWRFVPGGWARRPL
jgi:hypothetical protein